jgi:hypothetical protein
MIGFNECQTGKEGLHILVILKYLGITKFTRRQVRAQKYDNFCRKI